jgi:hypothetical protein
MKNRGLRDPELRKPLQKWLERKFLAHNDTEILHELRMPRPSGRVDIAVVNGRLSGFEIKSDFDSLSRLPRQVRAFSAVFDEMCVVTTSRHSADAKKIIPSWWRLTVHSKKNGKRLFRTVQKGCSNPNVRIDALLHMLTRSELSNIFRSRQLDFQIRTSRRFQMIERLIERLEPSEIQFEVRRLLKTRAKTT